MDPLGPWATYNPSYTRLTGTAGSYQGTAPSGRGNFGSPHHASPTGNNSLENTAVTGLQSANSQLLLQTAHSSTSVPNRELMGHTSMAAAFGSGSFLTQTSGSYDPVFSTLFHHPEQKLANYGPCATSNPPKHSLQHTSATKQNALESEITRVREKQQSSTYFEQQAAGSPSSLSSTPSWSHQTNVQIPSPFGILPHETVGNGVEKGSSICEGDFNVQFTPNQNLNNMNSQLSPALEYSKSSSDYNKIQIRKPDTLLSPGRTAFTPASSAATSATFYQHSPATFSNVGAVSSRDSTSVVCATTYRNDNNKCQQQLPGVSDFVSSGKGFVSPAQLPTPYHQASLDTKLYSEFNSSEHMTQAPLPEEHSQSPPVNFSPLNNGRQTVTFTRNENGGTCSTSISSGSVPTSLGVEEQHGKRALGVLQQTIHKCQSNSDASFHMQQYSSSLVDSANYGSSPSFSTTETKSYSEPLLCIANDSLKHGQSDCGNLTQTHSPASMQSHPSPLGHVPSPLGHVPSPLGHVPSPLGHVPSPLSHVPSPLSHVQSPRGHVPSPLGHNPSPHSHNLSPHAHASSPAYPVYHSPVGMVPSASYVQPLSPEVSLRQCPTVDERSKIVSHSADSEPCSTNSLRVLPKSKIPSHHVINRTSGSAGVAQRQKLDECDIKDGYNEDSDLHRKGNRQDNTCRKQNVIPQMKEESVEDESSPYYKVCINERDGGDSSAATMLSVVQTPNLPQTSTLLQPQDILEPSVSMEQEGYIESSSSCSEQASNDIDKHAATGYSAALQQEGEPLCTGLLSTGEVTEAQTKEHSSHLIRATSEGQQLVSAEEAVTQNSASSYVTHIDRNREQQDTDSRNNSLNEKLVSPKASVVCENVLKQRSETFQDSVDVSDNEYQSATASVTQPVVTDLPSVQQSSDSIRQISEVVNMSSEMKSDSQQPSDLAESFNEINRKVTLINIEDDLECLLEDSSVYSHMTLEQDVKMSKQKYFLQNRSGFLDGYMKFLNEERRISVTKSKSTEKSADKDTQKKVRRKRIAKNADISGTSTKVLKQSQQDEDWEESSYTSDVTSDTSDTENMRSKGKRTEWMSRDSGHQEDEGSERKRQKLDKEDEPEKQKKNAKDSRGKSLQRSTIQLRRNSSSNPELSSKCNSFQSSYSNDPQSLDSQNSHEKEQRKRSRNVKDQVIAKRKMSEHKEDQTVYLPRREMTPRKAKEISNTKKYNLEEFEEDSDSEDMDSDPAWTPAAKEPSDDDNVNKRRSRRSRYMLPNCKRTRHASPDGTRPGGTEDVEVSKLRGNRTRQSRTRTHAAAISQNSQSLARPDMPSGASYSPVREVIADTNFRSGDFVIMKSDTAMEHPPLWRIDGRTLLQKYESFEQSGKTLYRNISTYTSWSPQNRHIYQQVAVRFVVQNNFETVVELQKNSICDDHQSHVEQSITETAKYYNSFEVYIQTLISQALDSNFLTEVLREHDDYFLTNLKTVDEVTEERMEHLLRIAKWPNTLRTSVGTWPCFNVIDEPTDGDGEGAMPCIACEHSSATARVQMYGQPYDRTTLEGCPPDPKLASQKDFLLCKVCVSRVELYNKVAHQKYHMYVECAKRVADKRSSNPSKDSMEILNELLADELWLRELFLTVRHVWAAIDTLDNMA
ncbi:uncharacterized protein LOC126175803 isoform X1 [Schistocerca cancellata]|uniref:uncharacterized protein LOC126175803 isoform X1 n=1 Tax=Schistocerca cancellata TaxID=274614 RepID=UPI00211957B7|nr:uncharacterized protein LOC126175803 isoform X1 [Schistocerca cancellata]